MRFRKGCLARNQVYFNQNPEVVPDNACPVPQSAISSSLFEGTTKSGSDEERHACDEKGGRPGSDPLLGPGNAARVEDEQSAADENPRSVLPDPTSAVPKNSGRFIRNFNPATDRLTLTEVRRKILQQTGIFQPEDIIPVPCHPDSLAMAYALKIGGQVVPLTSMIPPDVLINAAGNTILYEQEATVRENLFRLFATNHSPRSGAGSLRALLCCLPKVFVPESISYENVFRVIIMQFMDAHSFDVRSVKKTCVHIVHPDGRIIPFDTFNLFYRDEKERRLAELRGEMFTPMRVNGKKIVHEGHEVH